MNVWKSVTGRVFHKRPYCGAAHTELYIYAIEEIRVRPCRRCFPEAPKMPVSTKKYCAICDSRRPCRHNGGIYIKEIQVRHEPTGLHPAGSKIIKGRWIWPDSPKMLDRLLAG